MKNGFGQDMMPESIKAQLPPLYAQDGKGDDAIAYVKYFLGGFTWYGTEFDPDTNEMFGKTFSMMCPDGELGYFSLDELSQVRAKGLFPVERDEHFKPTPLKDCKNPCVAA